MPFRKDWKRLVSEGGRANRRLYETAVFATLRDKLRSGDVWVEAIIQLSPLRQLPAAAGGRSGDRG